MEPTSTPTNNLDTFSTLFLIKGILNALLAFVPLIYVFLGPVIGAAIQADAGEELPFDPGVIFIVIGIFGFLFIAGMAIISFIASANLKNRKGYKFIFAVSILNCLTGILGILLGVFTLVELTKPHVKELFQQQGNK